MQSSNEARATEIASKFAQFMGMAGWEPQDNFIAALQYAAQRLKI